LHQHRALADSTAERSGRTSSRLTGTTARILAVASILALLVVAVQERPSTAAPTPARTAPQSILPASVGIGIGSQQAFVLDFPQPMDVGSVAKNMELTPTGHVSLTWSADARHVQVRPSRRWVTDQRYVVTIPAPTRLANGSVLGAPLTYTFTTQTAPYVNAFSVDRVGPDVAPERLSVTESLLSDPPALPADTADNASSRTEIHIGFSAAMNHADVEDAFLMSPAVSGTFSWEGSTLVFTPGERLDPGARYAISIAGAHDLQGNPLGGDTSFSLSTTPAARVVKVAPANGATGVSAGSVQVWFSAPVDTDATQAAFAVVDVSRGSTVAGAVSWNDDGTGLTFKPSSALAAGHRFEVRIGDGAADFDGNALAATFGFTSRAATVSRPTTSYPLPPASGSAQAYALSLINASRKAYGFAPLRLDAALSAVAQAHANDQIRYGYFSHVGRDGSTYRDRITRAGISWSHAGENQCLDYGSITHAISWCHSIMMAEPYPGVWNHIANILDPNFNRVGFGYAKASDGKLIMTWDFAG
jgi:uncharacterized protein YkwD